MNIDDTKAYIISRINIPFYRNNPSYISHWSKIYQNCRDPLILHLMYYKRISEYHHYIYVELCNFYENTNLNICKYLSEKALYKNVYKKEIVLKLVEKYENFVYDLPENVIYRLLKPKSIFLWNVEWICNKRVNSELEESKWANIEKCFNDEIHVVNEDGSKWEKVNVSSFNDFNLLCNKEEQLNDVKKECVISFTDEMMFMDVNMEMFNECKSLYDTDCNKVHHISKLHENNASFEPDNHLNISKIVENKENNKYNKHINVNNLNTQKNIKIINQDISAELISDNHAINLSNAGTIKDKKEYENAVEPYKNTEILFSDSIFEDEENIVKTARRSEIDAVQNIMHGIFDNIENETFQNQRNSITLHELAKEEQSIIKDYPHSEFTYFEQEIKLKEYIQIGEYIYNVSDIFKQDTFKIKRIAKAGTNCETVKTKSYLIQIIEEQNMQTLSKYTSHIPKIELKCMNSSNKYILYEDNAFYSLKDVFIILIREYGKFSENLFLYFYYCMRTIINDFDNENLYINNLKEDSFIMDSDFKMYLVNLKFVKYKIEYDLFKRITNYADLKKFKYVVDYDENVYGRVKSDLCSIDVKDELQALRILLFTKKKR